MMGETQENEAAQLRFPPERCEWGILSVTFLLGYWGLDLTQQQL